MTPSSGLPDKRRYVRSTPGRTGVVGSSARFLRAVWGVTWWSSHDIDRGLLDFPEREYDLSLFTIDHRPKPAALALADHIRAAAPTPRPVTVLPCPIDLRTEPHRRAEVAPGSRFHTEWVRLRENGRVRISHSTGSRGGALGGPVA